VSREIRDEDVVHFLGENAFLIFWKKLGRFSRGGTDSCFTGDDGTLEVGNRKCEACLNDEAGVLGELSVVSFFVLAGVALDILIGAGFPSSAGGSGVTIPVVVAAGCVTGTSVAAERSTFSPGTSASSDTTSCTAGVGCSGSILITPGGPCRRTE